jgi:hypothetical protein
VRKFLDLLAPPGAYPLEKKHGAVCREVVVVHEAATSAERRH